MTKYLSYKFEDNERSIDTFDELPLWSAPFGLLLLKHLELRPDMTVLDMGSGAGFPLMELASRLGSSCMCYGLDTWTNANNRARKKISNYQLENVMVIEGSGEQIPLAEDSIDLVVSNLGINNFNHPDIVFKECHRVLNTGGRLVLTTNLDGHWKEFYAVFEQTIAALGKHSIIEALKEHQRHRGTIDSISTLFASSGFKVTQHFTDSFFMRFVDGSAFLNHYFVKLGWLESWKALLPADELEKIFGLVEHNLNIVAANSGGIQLTVPMAYVEGEKI